MKKGDMILGKVSLNAFKIKDKKKPYPVIQILNADYDGVGDGDLVVLKVELVGK